MYADPAGCWVTGPDGVHRADADGGVRKVSDESVWLAAAQLGLLLIQAQLHTGDPHSPVAVRLITPAGSVIEVDLLDRMVEAALAVGHEPGFVMMLRHRDLGEAGLLRLDLDRRWAVLHVVIINLATALLEPAINRHLEGSLRRPDQLERWNQASTELFRSGLFKATR